MWKKIKSLFGVSSPVTPSSTSDVDRILICSLASIPASLILGQGQFPVEELILAARNKLAEYLLQAVGEGSEIAMDLALQLTEMGVFDAPDAVPCSDGLHGGDVSSEVDGDGSVAEHTG